MRSRSLSAQHDAAVARRLELLTSELAAVRGRPSEVSDATTPGPVAAGARSHAWPVPDDDLPYVDLPGLGLAGSARPPVGAHPPVVPRVPGRHASRRALADDRAAWSSLLPGSLRGQLALGPGQLAVVAVLVAAGLALTCWWLVRSGGHDVAAPSALRMSTALATPGSPSAAGMDPASSLPSGAAAAGSSRPGTGPAKVVVDVAGRVRHPGIAVLRAGARVVDALHAAGGARRGVDLGGLNLARVLTDGEQIVVGGTPVAAPPSTAPGSGAPVSGLVDINTADETTLESLPDVGPVTAQAILTWRSQHGGFSSVDQLLDVDGIGDATLAKLEPYVTV